VLLDQGTKGFQPTIAGVDIEDRERRVARTQQDGPVAHDRHRGGRIVPVLDLMKAVWGGDIPPFDSGVFSGTAVAVRIPTRTHSHARFGPVHQHGVIWDQANSLIHALAKFVNRVVQQLSGWSGGVSKAVGVSGGECLTLRCGIQDWFLST